MNILLIITIAALALALSSIGVAFSFKKAYDKKREESKEALKKYASIQHDHTLQAGVIQDLRDQITVLLDVEAKTENECCKLKAENAELKEVINHYEVNRQNQEIFREQIEKLKK
jgi:flagellar basal body-associated protein FliL